MTVIRGVPWEGEFLECRVEHIEMITFAHAKLYVERFTEQQLFSIWENAIHNYPWKPVNTFLEAKQFFLDGIDEIQKEWLLENHYSKRKCLQFSLWKTKVMIVAEKGWDKNLEMYQWFRLFTLSGAARIAGFISQAEMFERE